MGGLRPVLRGDNLAAVRRRSIFLLSSILTVSGCGDDAPTEVAVTYEPSEPMGPCEAVEQQHPIEGQIHVPECSAIAYATKPPSSGNHYGTWAAYKSYANAVPEGYWVHDLEHGAVVLTHNCPDGCDADIAAAGEMLNALPPEPLCLFGGGAVLHRTIMTPDPNLDVPFAASAWGFTLRAKCFDAEAFRSFATRHSAAGPENLCADGVDLSTGVAPGCGQ